MVKKTRSHPGHSDEIKKLRRRLEETEATLDAIRQYIVDAFVVTHLNKTRVVTVGDSEFPYRMMVESMNEGAVTLIPDGTIFYCNPRFAEMIRTESEKLIGTPFQDLILPDQQNAFDAIFKTELQGGRGDFCLVSAGGECVPVQLSIQKLSGSENIGTTIIATDLTERVESEKQIYELASKLTRVEHEERYRISQILHDDLQQRLFAMKAQLSLVREVNEIKTLPPATQADLHDIQAALSEAIKITRRLSIDLSPAILHGEGLGEAIVWLSDQMKELHGLNVKMERQEAFHHLDDHMRVLLVNAVREFLFNVIKHSGTLEATVNLEQVNGRGSITISDRGKGFNVSAVENDPKIVHSLLTVRERLKLMGCNMEITSIPGDGTQVVIEFPSAGASA